MTLTLDPPVTRTPTPPPVTADGILGAAYGIYMGVDMALERGVLPDKENCARTSASSTSPTPARSRWRPSSGPRCSRSAAARTTTCST